MIKVELTDREKIDLSVKTALSKYIVNGKLNGTLTIYLSKILKYNTYMICTKTQSAAIVKEITELTSVQDIMLSFLVSLRMELAVNGFNFDVYKQSLSESLKRLTRDQDGLSDLNKWFPAVVNDFTCLVFIVNTCDSVLTEILSKTIN